MTSGKQKNDGIRAKSHKRTKLYLRQKSVITMKNQVRPTGLFTKGQNLVADGQTSKMSSTTSGAGQIETNSEGVLIRKWFDRWYVAESLCSRLRCKFYYVLISQQRESRRGRPIFFRTNIHNILCQALTWLMIEEIPAHLLRPRVLTRRLRAVPLQSVKSKLASCFLPFRSLGSISSLAWPCWGTASSLTDSLPESLKFSEDCSMPASTSSSSRRASSSAENKKVQDRGSKKEEKLLVQLWAEKHNQLESRESRKTWAHSMVLCFVHRFCS